MSKILGVLLALSSSVALGAPFLVSDPVPAVQGAFTIDTCAYTRAGVIAFSPVDPVAGQGVRCKVDLATDPRTGSVSLAFRDSVLLPAGGPTTAFSFGAIPAPGNVHVIP
jgi:hypothetical protein